MTEIVRTKDNVLVVDDVRTMKFDATYARTLKEAASLLFSQPWDEVWLDHDLDFSLADREQYLRHEYTIRPLVARVEKLAHEGTVLPVGMFILHTSNPVGRRWVAAALLPWYTVGVTSAEPWLRYERYPGWATDILFGDNDAEEL